MAMHDRILAKQQESGMTKDMNFRVLQMKVHTKYQMVLDQFKVQLMIGSCAR
jgi:hypothetical protein